MKTRGSWVKIGKLISACGFLCGLLLFTALRAPGKHPPQGQKGLSPAAESEKPQRTALRDKLTWSKAYGQLPLSFEENQGQTADEVRYVAHGRGYELFLTPQEAVLALRPKVGRDLSALHRTSSIRALRAGRQPNPAPAIRLRLEGTNPDTIISGVDRLPGKTSYFIGNNSSQWHTDVPSYSRVNYKGVYSGVDLVFYGSQRRLEYDFIVAPGADPKVIALKVEGAGRMSVSPRGDLVLRITGGEVELRRPVVYQTVGGRRHGIAGGYSVTRDGHVRFQVGAYDRSQPLILDPVLNYSSYLGGGAEDAGQAIAVDSFGDAFVAGQTFSTDFPAGTNGDGITAPAANSGASFVAELNPAGTQLLYSAYLIGTSTHAGDTAFGIAVDPSGKVYVAGSTFAIDFPTTAANAFNAGPLASNANGVAYLTKLDPTVSGPGSLLYSTYLAGTGGDFANAVATDASGNAYVVGLTDSADYPTKNAFQISPSTPFGNAFLTRIDTTQSKSNSLIYSTYLGGNAANIGTLNGPGFGDEAFGVAVDSAQNAYLAGTTTSTNSSFITTATAYQTAPPALNVFASTFISKINTAGTGVGSLVYSSYLAGSAEDLGFAIAIGPGPNHVAYVTGSTSSADFPSPGATTGAFDTTGAGTGKAFVTLVDTTKSGVSSVTYSTYLGGTGGDTGFGIAVDGSANAYVVGTTVSADFAGAGTLQALGAFQPTLLNSHGDAFIAKLNPGGKGAADLLYATFFGGSGDTKNADQGFGIAIDAGSPPNVYVTGETFSADLPVFSSLPTGGTLHGIADAFVAKLALLPTLTVLPTSLSFGIQPIGVASLPQTVTLTNNTNAALAFTSAVVQGGVPAAANTDFAVSSNTCGVSIASGASCAISVTFTPSAPASAETATLVLTDGSVSSPQNVSLSGMGAASAPSIGLAPTSLTFGPQQLSTTSPAQNVTLTNTGNAPLSITMIAASGDFGATSTGVGACPISPANLAAGANCTISVTFTPTALGTRTGTLTIADNAGGSPQGVPLSGTGIAPMVSFGGTTTLTFGKQPIGTSSASQGVTLTNTGNAPLTISSIAITGANNGDFSQTNNCPVSPATLAAAANCTINVTFKPTATGSRNGAVSVSDNAPGSPQSVSLTGTGTETSGDFDGDGKADLAVWRPSTGTWWVIPSSNPGTPVTQQWGTQGDVPVRGDFDGDGKTDYGIWRPSTGTWWIIPSSNPGVPIIQQWGTQGDIPVPGDYDGDGKTDLAIWRPSTGTWWIMPSSNPGAPIIQQWGTQGDIPVPGDYDGDGKTDFATWRPSTGTWWIIPSSNPGTPTTRQWGTQGDIPTPGDYDGDGKTDFAVWRPSNGDWYIILSSSLGTFLVQHWGTQGDIPVPVDYDGDGITDLAVWRPSSGVWWIVPSSAPATFNSTQWGNSTDVPVQRPIGQ